MFRECIHCKKQKPLSRDFFYFRNKEKTKFRGYCIECSNAKCKKSEMEIKKGLRTRKKASVLREGDDVECRDCNSLLLFTSDNFITEYGKLRNLCQSCQKIRQKNRYKNRDAKVDREKQRSYRKNNPNKVKQWQLNDKDKKVDIKKNRCKNYYYKNRDSLLKKYKSEDYKNKRNSRSKKRYHEDIDYKLEQNLRGRLYQAIKEQCGFKTGRSKELIGCDYEFLKNYIQKKFTPNMTWEHYQNGEIHIDHIIPCNSFDLTKAEDQRKCFHYTNLQPLWATTEIAIKYGESLDYVGNINKQDSILCN